MADVRPVHVSNGCLWLRLWSCLWRCEDDRERSLFVCNYTSQQFSVMHRLWFTRLQRRYHLASTFHLAKPSLPSRLHLHAYSQQRLTLRYHAKDSQATITFWDACCIFSVVLSHWAGLLCVIQSFLINTLNGRNAEFLFFSAGTWCSSRTH